MADTSTTSANHAAQGDAGEISKLALDYHWLRATFEPAHTDAEVNSVADQVATVVKAIADTRSKSIHDLRAKMAIFRLEEDGDLSDHSALVLIESLTTDLDAWPVDVAPAQVDAGDPGLHGRHYAAYLQSIAAVRALNDDDTDKGDDKRDAAHDASCGQFNNLMKCPAGTLAALLLKIRAVQHYAVDHTEGSVSSPRVYAELLGIIAADLEILVAGKAVAS